MSRRYVDALLKYRERELVIGGIWVLAGFKQVGIAAAKGFRGTSSYSLAAKLRMMVNSVTSFSARPLFVIVFFGLGISVLSLVALVYLLLRVLIFGSVVAGWASVMISVWFLGGLIILFLGVIGTYVAKTFIETKNRPANRARRAPPWRAGGDGDGGKSLMGAVLATARPLAAAEDAVARWFGRERALLVGSGTAAITLLLEALSLSRD